MEGITETPDWYDEDRIVGATFTFENGRAAYSGWVVDLGDGTCRLANTPLLGPNGPKYGDRVDLFYNPCSPLSLDRGSAIACKMKSPMELTWALVVIRRTKRKENGRGDKSREKNKHCLKQRDEWRC